MAATIELTDVQIDKLHSLAVRTGKSEEQLVSEALNKFIDEIDLAEFDRDEWRAAVKAAAGIWKDRDDLTDEFFQQLRKESNRYSDWSDRLDNGKRTD